MTTTKTISVITPKLTGTKSDALLKLMRRPKGASLTEMQKLTGWQAHSVRAALTGFRKKAIDITRDTTTGASRYRIEAEA
ncbi:DUF3489 domain-containing protein [Paraperlucidibaca sp.]|jgi:hypothetical protein|uniref:DUF3489 domain-containing protein n=1 Tax=Paraperlucidibaca sp. TaxID=2708021 RepID=UPI001B6D1320|nr:DUF3489 domain-containing protein [Paraperlucidibaca sp.]